MRENFNIIWVDDNWGKEKFDHLDEILEILKRDVSSEYGYTIECLKIKEDFSIDFVRNKIQDSNIKHLQRVDLVITDYNLAEATSAGEIDGFTFHIELKQFLNNKPFVLYSKNSTESITLEISQYIANNRNPNIFSNFSFFSSVPARPNKDVKQIKKIIKHYLNYRSELNILRGFFAHNAAQIEERLRKILRDNGEDEVEYMTFERLIRSVAPSGRLNSNLTKLRKLRNAFVHGIEEYDESRKQYKIVFKQCDYFEQEYMEHRRNFVSLKEQIDNELTNLI